MIINICGSGIGAGAIHWDDLQLNPGGVSTSFSGEYDEFTKSQIEQFKKLALIINPSTKEMP